MFDIGWQEKLFHFAHIQFPGKIAQNWFVKCHLTTFHLHQYEILNKYDINGKFTDNIPGPACNKLYTTRTAISSKKLELWIMLFWIKLAIISLFWRIWENLPKKPGWREILDQSLLRSRLQQRNNNLSSRRLK